MSVPLAQRNRNLRRFPLRRKRYQIAGSSLSLVAPVSMDAMLEGAWLAHYERLGYLPYWVDVWPAAIALARFLRSRPGLAGKRALDLGCGVGLAGIAAGVHGAVVTFADRDPDALEFARFNAELNGLAAATTVRLDWMRQAAPGTFDLLLLADVAYEKAHFDPLLRHLRGCLAPGGEALLADPYRSVAGEFLGAVAREFTTETHATDAWHDDKRVPVRVVVISASPR
jgi:predicted nicotinamide N-methyase